MVYPDSVSVSFPSTTFVCPGDSALFDPGLTGVFYLWSTGDTTQSIYLSEPGIYWIKIFKGGCTASDTFEVITITSNLDMEYFVCPGDSVFLDPVVTGAQNLWSTGDTISAIYAHEPGIYWVQILYNSCYITDTTRIKTIEYFIPNDTLLCLGDSINISPGPISMQYLWSTGSTSQQIIIKQPGQYWVNLSDSLCNITDTFLIRFPDTLNLPTNLNLCGMNRVRVFCNVIADQYFWSTGTMDPYLDITKSGTFVLEILQGNCPQRDTLQTIGETGVSGMFFPNTITPDNDGLNDVFVGQGQSVTSFSLKIFNQFGRIVFETNDPYQAWDGSYDNAYNGETLLFYIAEYTSLCDATVKTKKTGTIRILK